MDAFVRHERKTTLKIDFPAIFGFFKMIFKKTGKK